MKQIRYHLQGVPTVLVLALLLLAFFAIPTPHSPQLAQADTLVNQAGAGGANVGGLGSTAGTGKITMPSCIGSTGAIASTWSIRRYATVDTGTVLFTIRLPANTLPTLIPLDTLVKGYGTVGSAAEAANKGAAGLKVDSGGMRISPVTAYTDSRLSCTYR